MPLEWHNFIPEEDDYDSNTYEYHKFFDNNKIDRLLGLSAWIPEKKRPVTKKICPVIYTLTTDEGVKRGIISPYIEYNIPVQLSTSEVTELTKINHAYYKYEQKMGGAKWAFSKAAKIMKKFKDTKKEDRNETEERAYVAALMFWRTMQQRKKFLYNCKSKVQAVHKTIDALKIEKSVIFSQSTAYADMISDRDDILSYHSKLKKKEKIENMKSFEDGRTKVNHLSTCEAVNEGMDLPRLPVIIIASRTSSEKAHIQRRGRCLRWEEGKNSVILNFYIPNTQDEKWLRKSQETTDQNNIKWIRSLKEINLMKKI